jgi:dihydrofolate reductase
MRDVVLAMNTTVNGRLDDPEAWFVGLSDDLYTEIDRGHSTFDTILVGRVTYDEMYEYWPGAETEEGDSEINRRMAKKQNAYKKYVFTRTAPAEPLAWNNSEAVTVGSDADIVEFVRSLKEQPGADIYLAGGAQLAQTFVRLGLVDELRFFVHPVFSPGEPWFGMLDGNRHLKLVSATPFQNGAVSLYYRPTDATANDDGRTGSDLWAADSTHDRVTD